ncbi:RNA 2',3'-cyclic phosphodiesterase [Chondromyces apiculatus]|uniref:RNA 2',3'-cyclic phosphodiesterase n=1 Tax=Chondromyces apiculatus DSM 436 TaxID=1192034 RepID=A0A017T6Y8_9BACT|nr:RNA 2',3'-cyclic phosphodiesterase [Chondromyces apiculatus]EYF04356.1 2'-5' RNA ligase [Chondromyces apiculatus DSM 436]
MRVFVAVEPGAEQLQEILPLMQRLNAKAPSAKWVDPAGLHISLAFLGDIAEERVPLVIAAAESASALHRPVTLRLGKGGVFGAGRRPRVLWLKVTGDVEELGAVRRDLEQALAMSTGYVPEMERFEPHLTLARSRDPRGDPGLEACAQELADADFGEVRVTEIVVYRSELTPKGAVYTVMARAPLTSLLQM